MLPASSPLTTFLVRYVTVQLSATSMFRNRILAQDNRDLNCILNRFSRACYKYTDMKTLYIYIYIYYITHFNISTKLNHEKLYTKFQGGKITNARIQYVWRQTLGDTCVICLHLQISTCTPYHKITWLTVTIVYMCEWIATYAFSLFFW